MSRLERYIGRTALVISAFSLTVIMLSMLLSIFMRFFSLPAIEGLIELATYLLAVSVFISLSYTQTIRGHVGTDMVISRIPSNLRKIILIIGHILCLAFVAVMTWRLVQATYRDWSVNNSIPNISFLIPTWPYEFLCTLGSFLLFIVFLLQTLIDVRKLISREKSPKYVATQSLAP
jgi:TRAP-type C4-dicarboxylate transport system permease small subunit